jgi:hypothetical protein
VRHSELGEEYCKQRSEKLVGERHWKIPEEVIFELAVDIQG